MFDNRRRPLSRAVCRPLTEADRRSFGQRVILLFGHRDIGTLQIAFERGHTQIEAWLHLTRPLPRDVLTILDLLESCPHSMWPERWKACRRFGRQ